MPPETSGWTSTQEVQTNLPTYWEKAVWLTFNPSNDAWVQRIKTLFAEIIDIMDDFRKVDALNMQWEHKRLASVAITEAQTAQMRAVKAITWRDY